MDFTAEMLNILVEFGAGRGDLIHNSAVRFLLPSFFWCILAFIAFREWTFRSEKRDMFVGIAALVGLSRELFLFVFEYGGRRGLIPLKSSFGFFPPWEHTLTMFSCILIGYAFMTYFLSRQRFTRIFLMSGIAATALIYLVTTPTWAAFLNANPGARFGQFWGDMVFHVMSSVLMAIVLGSLALGSGKGINIPKVLYLAFSFLFLDDFLMVLNLATGEIHGTIYTPIRHNLHIWAVPLFMAVYWNELFHSTLRLNRELISEIGKRRQAEKALMNAHEGLERKVDERTFELKSANEELEHEIIERRRTEKALKKRERQLSESQEVARIGSWSWDVVNNTLEWSDETFRRFDKDPAVFTTSVEYFVGLVHPDDSAAVQKAIQDTLENDTPYHVQPRIINENGREWVMEAFGIAERDANGRPLRFAGTAQDITERRQGEEELDRYRKHLEELVKKRTAETLKAKHLASIGELAAGVAHEINNPVNSIINYAQILIDESPEGPGEQDIPVRIIKEGNRIALIVQSLLSFGRENREEKVPADIGGILDEILVLMKAQLKKDGIGLEIDIPDNMPQVTANRQQLQQVFLNLLSNARYALNQKYPSIAHGDKTIGIRGESIYDGDIHYMRLIFHDNGTGIPDDVLDRVTNPFFTTKPAGQGTGLGLSISHGIIKDHGGRLLLESRQGEFTRAIIDLPIMEENDK